MKNTISEPRMGLEKQSTQPLVSGHSLWSTHINNIVLMDGPFDLTIVLDHFPEIAGGSRSADTRQLLSHLNKQIAYDLGLTSEGVPRVKASMIRGLALIPDSLASPSIIHVALPRHRNYEAFESITCGFDAAAQQTRSCMNTQVFGTDTEIVAFGDYSTPAMDGIAEIWRVDGWKLTPLLSSDWKYVQEMRRQGSAKNIKNLCKPLNRIRACSDVTCR